MAKRKFPRPKGTKKLANAVQPAGMSNGLADAISGAIQMGIPGVFPGAFGSQVNQLDTIYLNQRWQLISNQRQVLSQFYVEHGLVQTIVDVPVDDAMRGGVEIKSKQLSPEQIEELQTEMKREGDCNTVAQALKWKRLYGGAGVLTITDQDPAEPLDLEAINESTPLVFRAVDMWELYPDQQNISEPSQLDTGSEFFRYNGWKTHKTRVVKMVGREAPSFIRPRLRGWGVSEIEHFVNAVNDFLKSKNLTFEVLDEFKLDIFKIKGLTQSLFSKDGTAKIQQRIQAANQEKNFLNALTMDSEDDYIQKQLTFSGLAEMKKEFRMDIACAMRMPLTKIFGISAAGFNSGEDDIENYNAMIESQIRAKAEFDILRIIEIRCQRKFGFIPGDISIAFKPLRMLSAEQEENVKTQKFNRILAAKNAGEINAKEFRDGCNKGNLLDIQLDTDAASLPDPEDTQEDGNEEGDPGADRISPAKAAPVSTKRQPKDSPEAA